MNTRINIIFLALLIFACAGCSEQPAHMESSTRHLADSFSVYRATVNARLSTNVQATLKTEILTMLEDGTAINAGDIVATLSPGDRTSKLQMAEIERSIILMKLHKQEQLSKLDNFISFLNEKKSLLELEKAEEEYAQATNLRPWLKIFENQHAQKMYEFEAKITEQKNAAQKKLEQEGFASRLTLIDSQLQQNILLSDANYIDKILPWLEENIDEIKVFGFLQNLETASEACEVAKLNLTATQNVSEILVQTLLDELANKDETVQDYKSQIASLTIYAPSAGIVYRKDTFNGIEMEKIAPGDLAYPGLTILSILDCGGLGVTYSVDQSMYTSLKNDSKTFFRPDAFPEMMLEVIATETSLIASELDLTNTSGDRNYFVKAVFKDTPLGLMLGMTGTLYAFDKTDNRDNTDYQKILFSDLKYMAPTNKKFSRKLVLPGTIEPLERSMIVAPYSGKIIWIAEDGAMVEKSDIIARLDTSDVQKRYDELLGQKANRQQQFELHKQKAEIELAKALRKRLNALGNYEIAVLEHNILLNRRDEDEIITLKKQKELLQNRLQLAQESVSHDKDLFNKGIKSEIDLLNAELEVVKINKEIAINEYKLELEESGPTKRQVKISEILCEISKITLDIAEAEYEKIKFDLENEALIIASELKKLELQTEIESRNLELAEVKSPRSGMVILPEVLDMSGGISRIKVGDEVNEWIPFMNIVDLNSLEVKLQVSEMDIKFIKIGDQVSISLQSMSDTVFKGWVKTLGVLAIQEPVKRQDAVVDVYIALTNVQESVTKIDPAFRPRASCEVTLNLYEYDANLYHLPFIAVIPDTATGLFMDSKGKMIPLDLVLSDGLNGFLISEKQGKLLLQ